MIFILQKFALGKRVHMETQCYHCGNLCDDDHITLHNKSFCCNGCKTVYEIFSENDLTCYYDLQENPGAIPEEIQGKYDYLDNEKIIEKLLEFNNENSVLEIGHGNCGHLGELLSSAEGIKYFGLEISETMLKEAKTMKIDFMCSMSQKMSDDYRRARQETF